MLPYNTGSDDRPHRTRGDADALRDHRDKDFLSIYRKLNVTGRMVVFRGPPGGFVRVTGVPWRPFVRSPPHLPSQDCGLHGGDLGIVASGHQVSEFDIRVVLIGYREA